MGKALGIVYRTIATHLIHTAGFSHATARTGAITFIQRFGSALNLNVHFHMLFLEWMYITGFDQQNWLSSGQCPTNRGISEEVSCLESQ